MGPFWMGTILRRGTLAFPMATGSIKSQWMYKLCVPSSMSARYSDFLSPAENGPVLTNPNMSLNLLERYKSGANSSDASFVSILSLVFCGLNGIEFDSDRWVAPRPHLFFFI